MRRRGTDKATVWTCGSYMLVRVGLVGEMMDAKNSTPRTCLRLEDGDTEQLDTSLQKVALGGGGGGGDI